MDTNQIMMLGIGLQAPWQLDEQHLNTDTSPYGLLLKISPERGHSYPYLDCGVMCSTHDYVEKKWRHLNFFQHHCYLTAKVPRVKCGEHGTHLATVPWARVGSGFTLLFEQVVLALVREMPVMAILRLTSVTDKRLWRIILHYVNKSVVGFDLSELKGVALDETVSKRSHNYITTFLDMDKPEHP